MVVFSGLIRAHPPSVLALVLYGLVGVDHVRPLTAQATNSLQVSTGAALQSAVNGSATHVLLVAHTDMFELQPIRCLTPDTSALLCVNPATHPDVLGVSIRGSCKAPPSAPSLPLRSGRQCIVGVHVGWLAVAGRNAWLASLYVYVAGGAAGADTVTVEHVGGGALVWNEGVALWGAPMRPGRGLLVEAESKMLFAGSLSSFNAPEGPALLTFGAASLVNTTVTACHATADRGWLAARGEYGLLKCQGCSHDIDPRSPAREALLGRRPPAAVHADAGALVFNQKTVTDEPAKAMGSQQPGLFLALNSSVLAVIQLEAAAAFPYPGAWLDWRWGTLFGVALGLLCWTLCGPLLCWIRRRQPHVKPAQGAPPKPPGPPDDSRKADSTAGSGAVQRRPATPLDMAAAFQALPTSPYQRPPRFRPPGLLANASLQSSPSSPSHPSFPSHPSLPSDGTKPSLPVLSEYTASGLGSGLGYGPGSVGGYAPPPCHQPAASSMLPTLTVPSMTTDINTASGASHALAAQESPRTRVAAMMDWMYREGQPLFGRFTVAGPGRAHRRRGGQALVQFVEDLHTREPLAAKLFSKVRDFEQERELYGVDALRAAMPSLVMAHEGGWSPPVGPSVTLPPCLVMQQGKPMSEYVQKTGHDLFTTIQALGHVARKLGELHRQGWVHRDLKPGNLLWNPNTLSWSLLDFGCAARVGTRARIAYTLAYAAPEVLAAEERGDREVLVLPAIDMWALGVIAFEMLTEESLFPPLTGKRGISEAISGRIALPWEDPQRRQPLLQKLGVFKKSVLACLERDPGKRINCAALYKSWTHMFSDQVQQAG